MFERLWGSQPILEVNRRVVAAWAQQRKQEVSNSTVLHELALLRVVFNLAEDEGWIGANPASRLRVGRIHKRSEWLRPEKEADLRAAYADAGRAPEFSIVRFAILTGLRRGEQAFLRPDHLRGDVLIVPQEGKTGTRSIPLHPEAATIALRQVNSSKALDSPWVFWPEFNGPNRLKYASNYQTRVFRQMTRKAGLEWLQWRDLCRTFGCRLIAKGVSIFEVQKLLGHASPVQTMTYCQVGMEQLRSSLLLLE